MLALLEVLENVLVVIGSMTVIYVLLFVLRYKPAAQKAFGMKCGRCHSTVSRDAKVCNHCGNDFRN